MRVTHARLGLRGGWFPYFLAVSGRSGLSSLQYVAETNAGTGCLAAVCPSFCPITGAFARMQLEASNQSGFSIKPAPFIGGKQLDTKSDIICLFSLKRPTQMR